MRNVAPPTREQLRDHLESWHGVNYLKTRNVSTVPLADWHHLDHSKHRDPSVPTYAHDAADLSKRVELDLTVDDFVTIDLNGEEQI
jgi:hypothetical protein